MIRCPRIPRLFIGSSGRPHDHDLSHPHTFRALHGPIPTAWWEAYAQAMQNDDAVQGRVHERGVIV
jgi:hypothetical protein